MGGMAATGSALRLWGPRRHDRRSFILLVTVIIVLVKVLQ
jgi:hypothetical protein